ncbi:unnamed protein product [Protopolystoma xenopodis]|uniref:Uncharacterized protein n=1 Tax=Protopolystoma xenopodis TaxID=117903 RepID=A0A3S5B143_9PLAT|nr:unnamed protein product [Protopolystoma xenopodis]
MVTLLQFASKLQRLRRRRHATSRHYLVPQSHCPGPCVCLEFPSASVGAVAGEPDDGSSSCDSFGMRRESRHRGWPKTHESGPPGQALSPGRSKFVSSAFAASQRNALRNRLTVGGLASVPAASLGAALAATITSETVNYTSSSEQSCDTVIYLGRHRLPEDIDTDNEGPPEPLCSKLKRIDQLTADSDSVGSSIHTRMHTHTHMHTCRLKLRKVVANGYPHLA